MFINTMKNSVAKHILSRIYAIRLAETMTKFEYAATLMEAANWVNAEMNKHGGKEYDVLYRFYMFTGIKAQAARMDGLLYYNAMTYTYSCKPVDTVLHMVWNKMHHRGVKF
jgi:hypothetical protein